MLEQDGLGRPSYGTKEGSVDHGRNRTNRTRLTGGAGAAGAGLCDAGLLVRLVPGAPVEERPCRVLTYWDRTVRVALDTKGPPGTELPMLAGRVYFFGADSGHLLTPRGKLVVDWYDLSGPPNPHPPLLGECVYGADDLQKMKSENMVGIGYTIVAPWQDYRPEVSRIRVQVAFLPEKGGDPVYAEPAIVALECDQPRVTITSRSQTIIPALPPPMPAKQ